MGGADTAVPYRGIPYISPQGDSYGRGVDDLKLEAEAGPSERWKLARSSE